MFGAELEIYKAGVSLEKGSGYGLFADHVAVVFGRMGLVGVAMYL